MNSATPYKTCVKCGTSWQSPADLVGDRRLLLNGYQAAVPDAEEGLLLFTHLLDGCNSTLGVPVRDFRFMYDGPLCTECRFAQPDCEGHCLDETDLEPCKVQCCMAWARELVQFLRRHELPKRIECEEPGA